MEKQPPENFTGLCFRLYYIWNYIPVQWNQKKTNQTDLVFFICLSSNYTESEMLIVFFSVFPSIHVKKTSLMLGCKSSLQVWHNWQNKKYWSSIFSLETNYRSVCPSLLSSYRTSHFHPEHLQGRADRTYSLTTLM